MIFKKIFSPVYLILPSQILLLDYNSITVKGWSYRFKQSAINVEAYSEPSQTTWWLDEVKWCGFGSFAVPLQIYWKPLIPQIFLNILLKLYMTDMLIKDCLKKPAAKFIFIEL